MKTIRLEEINSTNDYAKKNMSQLEHMTAVYAERQTSGRGRLERKWMDTGEDNLFLTIVLKPKTEKEISNFPNLTQYLSVILSMLLEEEYNLNPQIKWPNDVLINGKKVAGILAEGTTHGGKFMGLALGVGVNLNTTSEKLAQIDKPATSVFNELGACIDREIFLKKLLEKFCLSYNKYIIDGFPFIKNDYEQRAMFLGKEITINVLGKLHQGVAQGVTDEGSLVLKEDDNNRIYYIGDIL